ncbi:3-deoxy-7-phosphoheptulonate synthase [bacterium]|nr:MAG: 3-deoxy-7-phosphoheptulonate synthase [bacterium]
MRPTEDVNVKSITPIIAPEDLKQVFPTPDGGFERVSAARRKINAVIHGEDSTILAIVGPCSIHEPTAALDYAQRLADLSKEIGDRLLVVMRVYFEKPRTAVGWKGLISDPDLNGTNRISKGLGVARRLLCEITQMGLPIATETLSPIYPQYFADLISWGGIGARTTQSQTHREMVSGLSFPVGFKNPTSGDLSVSFDAMRSARSPHSFLGISHDGRSAIIETGGNRNCHLVLRGSDFGPNFDHTHVSEATRRLKEAGLPPGIVVDCSHANSFKDHMKQELVLKDLIGQIKDGSNVCGFMLESFIGAGSQKLCDNPADLKYGVSITDACIDWEMTRRLLLEAAEALER